MSFIPALQEIFPPDRLLTAKEDILPYSFDGTATFYEEPLAVVFAKTAEEIQKLLQLAHAQNIPIVTRGSGTGLSGGSLPVKNCVVLCTVKMDRIIELDAANLTLTAEPGVTTIQIAEAATVSGLFYPPDPGSMKISTIGGNVAENSGGLRGLKYGVTRDYVMGLEVVLPSGELAWFGSKCVKDVAGYSMKDVFVGSEGTLGIITKVLLKLLPQPAGKKTLLALFDSMEDAARTVSAIIAAKIIPCTLEFLDQMTLQCVEDYVKIGLPTDVAAVLLIESDGHPAAVADEAEAIERIAKENGARSVQVAQTADDAARLASARRAAFSALARVAPTTILEDATVPRSELARMVEFCRQVAEKHKLKMGIFGHMGDGNLHPTFLTNEKDTEEMHRVEAAMLEIFNYAISLGGTITGEHGVGMAKKTFLPQQFNKASLDALRALKKTLDPANLLNPGKIFDL